MQGQYKIAPISTRLPLTKITTTNFQAVKRRSEDAASSELDRKRRKKEDIICKAR